MTPYIDLAGFRARTFMSVVEVDYVEQDSPGFTEARIAVRTSWIHQRLRKRYGNSLPFCPPIPEILLGWIVTLVTYDVLRKRGINPQDPFAEMVRADVETALVEIKEAADSKDGLFDLPCNEDGDSNVTTGGPLGYSETSPYIWADIERSVGVFEDAAVRNLTRGDNE